MTILITNQGHNSGTTGATIALPIVSNIVVGSSIVVAVNENSNSGVAGNLADDAGNAYTILSQASPNNGAINGRDTFWVCHNCKALNAGQNITYTKNTSGVGTLIAAGSVAGGPFLTDKIVTPTTGFSTSLSISSGTLSDSNEAVFAFLGLNGSAAADTFTQVLGFAVPFDNLVISGGPRLCGGSEVVSSNTSVVYNPTIGTSRVWCLQLATFKAVLPTVTSITPTNGTTLGGTSVTITGTNFTGATSVTFGGAAATSVVVVNSTTITANTPVHAAGVVDIVVTTPNGSGTGTGLYTYITPPPTVSSITPTSGPTNGNTSVTITGTNLTGASSVTFGGTAATSVVVVNSTTITAVTPAHTSGVVDVAVTTPGGTGTGSGLYTYLGVYQKQNSVVISEIISGANFVTKNVTGKLLIHEGQQVKAGKSINKVIII